MMKRLALASALGSTLVSLCLAACGSSKHASTTGGAGDHHAAVAGDVDGDGHADEVTLSDRTVTVAGVAFAVPADFTAVAAHLVDLGTETVVVLDSEVEEDDLTWRVLEWKDGALHDVGNVFVGGTPGPDALPGDGTIHIVGGNCGQTTTTISRIVDGKIESTSETTGTRDDSQCAACPYVLVDRGDGLAFVGEALRNLSSPARETEDALDLPALDGRARELIVVLSEVKPETTYLDAIAVDFGGVRVAPRACAAGGAACADDDAHDAFTRGERRRFVFDVPAGFTGTPRLFARGYYEPFAVTAH